MNRKRREQAEADGKPCRLCLLPKTLQRSHVVPEFMHELLYDEKRRFWSLTTRDEHQNPISQQGEREYLLCASCEAHINVYEKYADTLFRSTKDIGIRIAFDGPLIIVHGIDYKLFKLFQLSILWRASITALRFYDRVQLGPLEEEMRLMLLRNDPGPAPLFSCLIYALRDSSGEKVPLMLPPTRSRFNCRSHYRFIFHSYVWIFVASRTTDSRAWDACALTQAGRLVIGHVPLSDLDDDLHRLMNDLDEMGRVPSLK
jgi:hypothetical protein